LAVSALYAPGTHYYDVVNKTNIMMKALGTLKNRYKLNAKTTLCPVTKQDTRWGSVCKMADRAIDLFDILATCGFDIETL
jgi:hypothetical protein